MERNEKNNRTPNNERRFRNDRKKNSDSRERRFRNDREQNGDSRERRFRNDREQNGDSRERRFRNDREQHSDSRERRFRNDREQHSDSRERRFHNDHEQHSDSRERRFRNGREQHGDSHDSRFRNDRYKKDRRSEDRTTQQDENSKKSGLTLVFSEDRPTPTRTRKDDGLIRLNKYIANAGICSRREADELIAAGSVTVNGKVVTEMGFKVSPTDEVAYGGETLHSERKRYFLLNKPKGFITTVDDPQERQTVMMLIDSACRERIYPVGRLDRNTTGLLLFTNDGEMARRLTHPSTGVYKIYHVEVNKPVTHEDMQKMLEGIELEDGMIKVDEVEYVEGYNDKRIVGVALHSGKNRIVRRIFEHLGYEIHKLDRVVFAGLTKKDLPRGRYRELTEKEVNFLKMI